MRGRLLHTLFAPALVVLAPGLALSQEPPPGCPPGEWFCEEVSPEGEPAPVPGGPPQEEPPEEAPDRLLPPPPPPDRFDVRRRPPRGGAADSLEEVAWSEGSGDATSAWGLALRVEGIVLESRRGADSASLGGVGASLRYQLNQTVTLDLGVDSIVGSDYDGRDRAELGLSLSTLLYLNQHQVVRTYVLLGLNGSAARVEVAGEDQRWGYFGAHAGLGLDFALHESVSLTFDFLGFMRGRTDSRAEREPEFADALGRVTNTSGGGLLRAGVALRF